MTTVLEWCPGLNHHGSKAWVKVSELFSVAFSTVLSLVSLDIILSKYSGELTSASRHSGTSVTQIWGGWERNQTQAE